MPGYHALLNASSAKQWLNCPPSVRLSEGIKETGSTYADEGTFAHSLGDLKLRKYFHVMSLTAYNNSLAVLKANKYYSPELEEYIDGYVDYVLTTVRAQPERPVVLLEQRLDFSQWVPDGSGTGDVIILTADGIIVIDLKYGKGIPVDATENPQLKLYGLGAYNNYGLLCNVQTLHLVIYQPRLHNISEFAVTLGQLLGWANDKVKPLAAQAFAGKGDFSAGDHCRFCRVNGTCRERSQANLALARLDFAEPALLEPDEVATVLAQAAELNRWAKAVQDYAQAQAINHGQQYPGYKLVHGTSRRSFTDPAAVAIRVAALGYLDTQIHKPKELLPLGEIETLLGAKTFSGVLKDLVQKPEGKPTLVPLADKRPEISTAAEAVTDFQNAKEK